MLVACLKTIAEGNMRSEHICPTLACRKPALDFSAPTPQEQNPSRETDGETLSSFPPTSFPVAPGCSDKSKAGCICRRLATPHREAGPDLTEAGAFLEEEEVTRNAANSSLEEMCDTAGLEALIGLIGLRVVSYMWEK